MRVRILGCSGGIGGRHLRTTSMLVDGDMLVDAGTGVSDLTLPELTAIDHVFLTHSHLDHVACIPFIVDTVGELRNKPLTVWALRETIDALRRHVFNWVIWPDFTEIPNRDMPRLAFRELRVGQKIEIGARTITVLPANHTVPAVGYAVEGAGGTWAFTGDTTAHEPLWQAVNKLPNLRYLVIETAFSDEEKQLAVVSKHLSPTLLAQQLSKLDAKPEVFITHLKPSQIEIIMREVDEHAAGFVPKMLQNNHVFEL